MAPCEPRGDIGRSSVGWRHRRGIDLYRAITRDVQCATAATRGDLILPGARRPVVSVASDPRAAGLDGLSGDRLSPGHRAVLTGETVCIDDVLDRADENDAWCALAVASNVTSVLAVPLLGPFGAVAAVTLFADRPAHFGAERRDLAVAIAAEAAAVVVVELLRTGALATGRPASTAALGGHAGAAPFGRDLRVERDLLTLRTIMLRQAQRVLSGMGAGDERPSAGLATRRST